jgi:hypothetical protein
MLRPGAAVAEVSSPLYRRVGRWIVLASFFILHSAFSAPAQNFQPAQPDEIPPLSPPLSEIPPSLWEQFGWLLWLLIPLLLAVTGLAVWWILRPGKPPVLLAPAAQARVALARLQSQPEDGAMLSSISQTLRRYLINAFWLQPGEATTTEFCARLQASQHVGPELAASLGGFLRQCDERKFSPAPAPPLNAASRAMELLGDAESRRVNWRASALESRGAPHLSPTSPPAGTPQETAAKSELPPA